jgi:hypothetical protein
MMRPEVSARPKVYKWVYVPFFIPKRRRERELQGTGTRRLPAARAFDQLVSVGKAMKLAFMAHLPSGSRVSLSPRSGRKERSD